MASSRPIWPIQAVYRRIGLRFTIVVQFAGAACVTDNPPAGIGISGFSIHIYEDMIIMHLGISHPTTYMPYPLL